MANENVHQFPENKWTIQDKLTQLKNVMKLQDRASTQNEVRALAKCKNQAKLIKKLDKENDNFRETLDKNIRGNDLQRRTTMRNNRGYQLAYQRLPTHKIVENISQVLFNKIKVLDKLRYERRTMEDELMALKLQIQELKCADKFVMKTHREQEVANKVQNMIVKQSAARTVKETYEKMIKILKDDARNFDKTLASLKADKMIQSKCLLKATEMGQRATEELANLRDEYKIEEKNILTVMKTMDMTAKNIKAELERVTTNCRTAVRTESITRFGSIQVDEDEEQFDEMMAQNQLVRELQELEESLQKLKSVTEVLSFDEIYPRYKQEKSRLISESKKIDEECKNADKAREKTGALLLCIRMGLLSLSRKLDRIDTSSKYDLLSTALEDDTREGVFSTLPLPETDALDILGNVNRKMELLVLQIKSIDFALNLESYLRSKRAFEFKIINKNIIEGKEDEYELAMTEMLEELGATDDPLVPTRLDIKRRSARIVEIFGADPLEAQKSKGRPAKKKK